MSLDALNFEKNSLLDTRADSEPFTGASFSRVENLHLIFPTTGQTAGEV